MEHRLKTFYVLWGATIAILWTALRIARHLAEGALAWTSSPVPWGPVIFTFTVVCGLAGPILYRTILVFVCRKKTHLDAKTFMRVERHIILIGMASLFLAMGADVLGVPFFYRAGALLTAFYAVYCVFPSRKRLSLDRRLFRVGSTTVEPPRLRVVHQTVKSR